MPQSYRTPIAKLLIAALTCFLLAVGLCAAGGGFDTNVSQIQIAMSYAGAALGLASFVTLLMALGRQGDEWKRRRDEREK